LNTVTGAGPALEHQKPTAYAVGLVLASMLVMPLQKLKSYLKKEFWFKVKAGVKFKPE